MKELTKEDIWDTVIGGAILSTGGGGFPPSRELFDKTIDDVLSKGKKFKLIDPKEVQEDAVVLMDVGVGGGVEREVIEKYMMRPPFTSPNEERWTKGFDYNKWIQKWIEQFDLRFPLNTWSEVPKQPVADIAEKRLIEIIGKEPIAYISFEIGPAIQYNVFMNAALKGRPVVDADVSGYRAVPEVSLCTLNVKDVPVTPAVSATVWGDILIYEKVLSWQRFEDLGRYVAIISGGGERSIMSISGADVKEATVWNTVSKSINVGRAVRKANERGRDPTEAVLKETGGYKLFEGKIAAYTQESKGAFIWGEVILNGTKEFNGHTFKIWYKNENQISRLDDKPYVTSPDLICVLDAKTGYGLSNFWLADWATGREVVVVGIKCADIWRTKKGLKIFSPKHFGFDIEYKPLEKFFE